MATTKKNKVGSSRSTKITLRKAPVKTVVKPMKKTPAKKVQPPKAASRKPAHPVKNAVSKKPVLVAKPKVVKKTPPQAKPAKKPVPAVAAPKKDLVKKPVNEVSLPLAKPVQKFVPKPEPVAEPKKPRFQKGDLDQFKVELLSMRDRITGQSGSMRTAALQRDDEINPEEDGTDAFMRLQTLEQVSSQQQIIANIDESLRSIEKGSYGVCDNCGALINKPRLSVLPFAKNCIKCQSEMERPNRFGGRR